MAVLGRVLKDSFDILTQQNVHKHVDLNEGAV